jgi:hypothetical protein
MPQASVTISIPDDSGGLQEAFGLSGAARFHFGGPEGFQLEDIRVSGYSIFGQGATIAAPASSLRAPMADLANPGSMAIVSINDLSYLAVTYQDPNRVGLNDASILDSAAEFLVTVSTSTGTAIQGLTVKNGSVVKSVDATNDRTFLYQLEMTDAFKAAVQNAGANGVTVSVTFVDRRLVRCAWRQRGCRGRALHAVHAGTRHCGAVPEALRHAGQPDQRRRCQPDDAERAALPGRHLLQPDRRRHRCQQHQWRRAQDHRDRRRQPGPQCRRHGDRDGAQCHRQHLPLPADTAHRRGSEGHLRGRRRAGADRCRQLACRQR